MSLHSSQNDASHRSIRMGTHLNGQANSSVALRTRSPHSERLKRPSQELPDNAAHLDKQPSTQLVARPSVDYLGDFPETYQNEGNERESGRLSQPIHIHDRASPSHGKQSLWRARLDAFWIRNKGVLMVLLAELFSAFMITATRLLETEGAGSKAGMEPFQVFLFLNMCLC